MASANLGLTASLRHPRKCVLKADIVYAIFLSRKTLEVSNPERPFSAFNLPRDPLGTVFQSRLWF